VLKCYRSRHTCAAHRHRLGKILCLSSPVAGDGKIYCSAEEGDVFVVRAGQAFELLAHNQLGETCLATPAISEGTLFSERDRT
jgi:hypothetical protein